MPKIDIDSAPRGDGTTYPDEFAGPCLSRRRWKLGDAAGLSQFGVNLLRLPDGAWSSQRHWHEAEDEFVMVVEGEVVLIEDDTRSPTVTPCDYPDIDMVLPAGADRYFHRDGSPYPKFPRRT